MEEESHRSSDENDTAEDPEANFCSGGLHPTHTALPLVLPSASSCLNTFNQNNNPQGLLHMKDPICSPLTVPFTSCDTPTSPNMSPYTAGSAPTLLAHSMDCQGSLSSTNGSSAFNQSIEHRGERNGFRGSAFVPTKCMKVESPTVDDKASRFHGDGGSLENPTDQNKLKHHCVKEEAEVTSSESTSDAQGEVGENSDRATPEEGRLLRKAKRRSHSEEQCPVCGVTVRVPELSSHFDQEVEKLTKVNKSIKRQAKEESPTNKTYEQVKRNRQNRLTAKIARYKKKQKTEVLCPVCNETVSGSQEELNNHVEQCLKQRKNSDSEDEAVDVEGDETYEEYEWAGQTRTRSTSLVEGGLKNFGYQIMKQSNIDEDDQDLNVDGDDTVTYGQPQYTEHDVIPCNSGEPEDRERLELRKAVLLDSTEQPRALESSKWSNNEDKNKQTADTMENSETDSDHLISSLKEKIKDLEDQHKCDRVKCLICMESYTKPVVSITCWHVHCEECWLRTLGVKKLCPQCNMITFPSDLRRIYL